MSRVDAKRDQRLRAGNARHGANMFRDDLRQLIVVARAHDRRQVIAPGDRIDFADAVEIGQGLGNFVGLVSFGSSTGR